MGDNRIGTKYSTAANKHVIVIHSESKQSNANRSDGELGTYEKQFQAVMDGYAKWKKPTGSKYKRMLLFFNGGLQTTKIVKDAATGQIECIKDDGFYPVFMIWSSGILATYGEQSAFIRNGLLNKYPQLTTPLYIVSDIVTSIARAPQNWINETSRFIDSVVVSDPKVYSLDNDGSIKDKESFDQFGNCREVINKNTKIKLCLPYWGKGENPNLDNSPPGDFKRISGLVRFGAATPLRVASLALIVQSGKQSWNNMLRRSRNTVHHPGEFQLEFWNCEDLKKRGEMKKCEDLKNGDDINICKKKLIKQCRTDDMKKYWRGTGRFARFFQGLETCINGSSCQAVKAIKAELEEIKIKLADRNANPADRAVLKERMVDLEANLADMSDLKLTLVGHSMGAIVINELVPEFDELPFENIVFMGAATSIRDTKNAMVPLLRKNKNALALLSEMNKKAMAPFPGKCKEATVPIPGKNKEQAARNAIKLKFGADPDNAEKALPWAACGRVA